jgi:hypothetical protein
MRKIVAALLLLAFIAPGFAQDDTTWIINKDILDCTPRTLSDSAVLTLRLGPGHGKELAIRRASDNAWFFLVVESPPAEMRPLMSPESFNTATRIEFATSYKAIEWRPGSREEPIFSSPGTYDVFTSDNLELEMGGARCTARTGPNNSFKPKPLRGSA